MVEQDVLEAPIVGDEQVPPAPPQGGDEKLRALHAAVSKDYDIGDFETFKQKLQNPEKRKAFYNGIGNEYQLGSYDDFEKKIGFVTPPEHHVQHTPLHDIRHLNDLSVDTYTPQQSAAPGGFVVDTQTKEKEDARNRAKTQFDEQTKNLAKTWGVEPNVAKNAVLDFPDEDNEDKVKGYAELLKNNPAAYSRLKDANDIRMALAKSIPTNSLKEIGVRSGTEAANLFNHLQNSDDFEHLQENISRQQEIMGRAGLSNEYFDKLKNTQAPLINSLDQGLLTQYWNSDDHKLGLTPFQYAGLQTEKLFSPNKYQRDLAILKQSKGIGDNGEKTDFDVSKQGYEYRRGLENVLYGLETQGRDNTARYISQHYGDVEKKLGELKQQYQQRINVAQTPQEQQQIANEFANNPLVQEANKLNEGQQELDYSASEDERKFPLISADRATRLVKDAMDRTQGGLANTGKFFSHIALGAGESADNTIRWIKNTAINILGSDESKSLNNAKNIGHQELTDLSTYEPASYSGNESPVKISDELVKGVQKIESDPTLSQQQKEVKAAAYVRDNMDQVKANPRAGQQNLTGKVALFKAADVIGQILGIADQSMLLGGAIGDASKLQQMASTFTPMYMSTQNQLYQQALANGDEHPLLKSNLDAAIISLASLINPDIKVVKGMLGAETGMGKMLAGVDEATWNKVLSTNKPLVDKLIGAGKAAGRQLGIANLQYGLIVPTAQYITHKSILNEDPHLGDMIKDGVIQTSITMALPSLLHGIWGGVKATEVNPLQKYSIVEAGKNADNTIEIIDNRIKEGQLSEMRGHEMKMMVKHSGEILQNQEFVKTDGTSMNEREVADVVYNQLRKRVLEGKLKTAPEPNKPLIENSIHEIDKDISDIYTSDEQKHKTELNKLLSDNLDRIKKNMPAFEGPIRDAIAENRPEEVMQMIADQATETTKVDGKEVSSRAATEEIFGKELVDRAISLSKKEKEPNKANVQEESPSKVSVIRPEQVNKPETITIKPQEYASNVRKNQGQGSTAGEILKGSQDNSGQNLQQPQENPSIDANVNEQGGQQGGSPPSGQEILNEEWPFVEEPFDIPVGIKKAISESTRINKSLPPVELHSIGSDAEVLKSGKEFVDMGKINPREVVARVIDQKGIYSNDEAAAMQYYSHQLRVAEDNFYNQKREAEEILSKDPNNTAAFYSKVTAEQALGQLDDEVDAKTQSDRINSRSWGNLGNIMQIETDKSFSPSRVRSIIKDNYGGEIPEQVKEKLDKAIAERDQALSDLKKAKEKVALKELERDSEKEKPKKKSTIEQKKAELKKERETLIEELKKALKKDAGNMGANPLPIHTIEAISKLALNYFKDGVLTIESITNKIYEDLKDIVPELDKDQVRDAVASYRPLARSQATEKALKKAANKEVTIELLDSRRKTNPDVKLEVEPPRQKLNFEKDTEYIKAQQRLINAEYRIKLEKEKSYMSKESGLQKTVGWANRFVRLSILSGTKVLEKLAAAATIGSAAQKPVEEILNAVWGKAFPKIAAKADIDMGANAKAIGKYYSEFFNPIKFAKDTKDIIISGKSTLGKELDSEHFDHIPGLDLPTDLHQVIKEPVKRATFQYALTKIINSMEKQGIDVNNPLVLESARQRAFARAKYEIFMEDNSVGRKFGEWLSKWRDQGTAGAAKSFLLRFAFPVSKVPTNVARRLGLSVTGLPKGLYKAREAYAKGIENLSTDEANEIGRALTKGSIGLALWTAGIFAYKSLGGLYSQFDPNKKREMDDPKSDEMKIMGNDIRKPWQHALPFEIMQLGATFRHIYEKSKKDDKMTPRALIDATMGSTGAILEQIPVVETTVHAALATQNPYEEAKLGEDIKRRFEPQLLKDIGLIESDKKEKSSKAGRAHRK